VWDGKAFQPRRRSRGGRTTATRAAPGAAAARFNAYLGGLLADFRRALL
jgi:pyruvate dehydrogenase E2 component (dihydrolipoamide acetyltransferase)